jgi:thiosulfate dehydrogenase
MRSRALCTLTAIAASIACERPGEPPAAAAPGAAGDSATITYAIPHDSTIGDDSLGRSIRRGRALLAHTRDSLPRNVGNALACTSCHPDDGTRANAMPWVGVYGRFPQYRARSASVQIIEDRINDCFERSMNGTGLARDGRDMRDIIAYMAFLSRGVPVGEPVPGQGLPRLSLTEGDSAAGAAIFAARCARCHGANGEGSVGPPVWGPQSYNIGAGMSRLRTASAFIRYNMPQDLRGTLTDREAVDVAAYINAQPRPDLPGKERDWPNGDPPPDVAYPTTAAAPAAARQQDRAPER